MITATSRYASSTVSIVDDDRGKHQSVNIPAPAEKVVTFTYYQVDGTDSVDMMAYRLYGSGQFWWVLADANPEILDWQTVRPGTIIRIPNA